MFEDIIRNLEKINGMKFSLPIDVDADGYIDRACTHKECGFEFKVDSNDWDRLDSDAIAYCPMCRHTDNQEDFTTDFQLSELERQAGEYFEAEVTRAMKRGAESFNRRQPSNGLINMKLSVKGTDYHRPLMPISSSREISLKIQCEYCSAKYAVIGSAYFCPLCGHSSVEKVFEQSLEKIEARIGILGAVKDSVSDVSEHEAQNTILCLLESSVVELVTAFQRVCEEMYKRHPSADQKLSANLFQRLNDGSEYWHRLVGKSYEDLLSDYEYSTLKLLFQRRHLLSHSQGIVDERYIERSLDTRYKVGQRIVITSEFVLESTAVVRKLIGKLREAIDA